MAGCEVNFQGPGGDKNAGEGRVLGWVFGGAGLGSLVAYLNAAEIAGFAAGGAVGLLGLAIIVLGAAAGAIVGFGIGFAVNWFDRLHPQNPSTITLGGCVLC